MRAVCVSACLSSTRRPVIPRISAALSPEEHFVSPPSASMLANLTSCDPDTEAEGQREAAGLREGDRMRGRQMDGWRECRSRTDGVMDEYRGGRTDGVKERRTEAEDGRHGNRHQQSETFTIKQTAAAKSDFKENTTNRTDKYVKYLKGIANFFQVIFYRFNWGPADEFPTSNLRLSPVSVHPLLLLLKRFLLKHIVLEISPL